MAEPATQTVVAWPISSAAVDLRAPSAWSQDAIAHPEEWIVDRLPAPNDTEFVPRVGRLVSTATGAIAYLDGDMVPGVSYQITCPDLDNGDLTTSPTFTGPLRTVAQVQDTSDQPLADVAMHGGVDQLSGDIRASEGDYAMSGARATIETVIWANLLTPLGRLDWDPAFGVDLGLKRVRAVDLAAEQRRFEARVRSIPGVQDASVQVLFFDDHLTVSITVRVAGETLQFERSV